MEKNDCPNCGVPLTIPKESTDYLDDIIKDREKSYGPPKECLHAIALAWDGIIRQSNEMPLDADFSIDRFDVTLMLAAMKIVREAYCHKQDNIDDAINYLKFASDFAGDK
jgi:hypothetical protein